MDSKLSRIGIDIGYGDAKLARPTATGRIVTLTFPAILGRAETRARTDVGLGGKQKRIQTIEYASQTYFVGEGAIIESRLTTTRQDETRIGSTEERILMLAALARAKITSALVVTGLPVLWWNHQKKLVKSWRGRHDLIVDGKKQTIIVHEVRPVWQPLGSFYAHFLRNDGTTHADETTLRSGFGIIDVGLNTTDLTGLHDLRPVERWTAGVRAGIRDALEVISADIEKRYQVRRDIIELAIDLRRTGTTKIYQDQYEMSTVATSALESLAQKIVSEATRQWSQGDRFHTILITGGGAALVGEHINAAFPRNAEILRRPGEANAVGFAKFAQRKIFRIDRQ